jgi:Sec1 family
MSLEQMANATRGLPEFQEQTKKMSQHINMAQACSAKIGSMDLLRVGAIEQTMAIGTDDVSYTRSYSILDAGLCLKHACVHSRVVVSVRDGGIVMHNSRAPHCYIGIVWE